LAPSETDEEDDELVAARAVADSGDKPPRHYDSTADHAKPKETHAQPPPATIELTSHVEEGHGDDHHAKPPPEEEDEPELEGKKCWPWCPVDGKRNIPLLVVIPLAILGTGLWEVEDPVAFEIYHVPMDVQDLLRGLILYATGLISLTITTQRTRRLNGFTWAPITEVAQLFFGIFITIIPAVAILKAGKEGSLSFITEAVTNSDGTPMNMRYFWLCGILSSFLDNAPTFLIFFNMAGGDASIMSTALSDTLLAIACGAVFMGACTYIGNAPNFMVRAIVEESGIPMPSFGGYLVWVCFCLIPFFAIVSYLIWVWGQCLGC